MTTMTEVRELLSTNPAISPYKHGLLDENVSILRVGCSEEDLISQLVVGVLQDSCGSGGAVETLIPIRPSVGSTSMISMVRAGTLSAAIGRGLAGGLTSDFSPPFTFLEINRRRLNPRSWTRTSGFCRTLSLSGPATAH
jgi:hypothetical protein